MRTRFSAWLGVVGLLFLPASAALTWSGCQGTCTGPSDCGDGQFCSMAAGNCLSARAIGFCREVPATCVDVSSPVCGCDGKTYASECEASLAGQSVAGSTNLCAVACGPSTPCPKGEYCHYNEGVCGKSVADTGTCEHIPADCADAGPLVVCGCDGRTYQSLCDVAFAGTSVDTVGACACGGPENGACAAEEYCNLAEGTCAQANPSGTCARPPSTSCSVIYDPVCGCDGNTYDNSCEAAKKKASIYAKGGCVCGGSSGGDCNNGYFCDYGTLPGTCTSGTATGVCARIPDPGVCTFKDGPVCGCDGQTYDSTCLANAGGTSVAATSACAAPGP